MNLWYAFCSEKLTSSGLRFAIGGSLILAYEIPLGTKLVLRRHLTGQEKEVLFRASNGPSSAKRQMLLPATFSAGLFFHNLTLFVNCLSFLDRLGTNSG